MNSGIGKFALAAFCSIFVLVGLGVMSFGIWQILDATGSSAWPVSKGTITGSEFVVTRETDEHFRTRPDITYRYRVSGKEYNGDTLDKTVGDNYSPADTRRWINENKLGADVDVYVDPEDATSSVLKPGVPLEAWIFVAFGALFAGIPTIIGVALLFGRRRANGAADRSQALDDTNDPERPEVRMARRFRDANKSLFGYVIMTAFFSIFLVIGLVMLSFAIPAREREADSVNWPRAQGTVIYRGIEHSTSSNDNGTKHTYTPRVVYDYVIDGVTYTSEGITFSDAGSSRRGKAAEAIRSYPKGKQVTVCYNPEDFYDAALVPGTSSGSFVLLLIGAIFSAVGGLPIIGMTVAKLWKSLSLGTGRAATADGDNYDPFLKTEVEDPFDRPWDDHAAR